ncbi:capsular polysaccharide synthesis protein [Riemerella anatipestifer]|nr:capsular polysaccharide synthesis protein [Riemerella anatipestifer]MDY3528262.1 capsular polysaccharide synthesis protein [Riemerella anatipestifer]
MINTENDILWGIGDENKEEIPKKIWVYWESSEPSPIVEICLKQIRKLNKGYELMVLNSSNLVSFLPDILPFREDLPFANYSDIIRLNLLYEYGGIWIDASTLLTEDFSWLENLKSNENADVIGFCADHFMTDFSFPILETWFLACPPKNKFIKEWLYEFEACYWMEEPIDYFEKELSEENFSQGFDEQLQMYLICYLAAMKVMRKNDRFRLYMKKASLSAHYYMFGKEKLLPHKLAYRILKEEERFFIPPYMIKLTQSRRKEIDYWINTGRYSKKGLLFKMYNESNFWVKKMMRFPNYIKFIVRNVIKCLNVNTIARK